MLHNSVGQHRALFPHLCNSEIYHQETNMKFKKQRPLLGVLLGAGLYHLAHSLRERLPDNMDDVKGKVWDTYGTASDRVSRASDALRGKRDSQILGKVGALGIGIGIGVGIGLLIAPAGGEETRAEIRDKVSKFSDKVRESAKKPQDATGTHGA
jgi:YtxH-like protein